MVATETPISILELTLKAPELPVQEVEDFSFVFTR